MLYKNQQGQIYSGDRQGNDVELTSQECQEKMILEHKVVKTAELKSKIAELDFKSIRAFREGGIKDATSGQTWLEYYLEEIQALRVELAGL